MDHGTVSSRGSAAWRLVFFFFARQHGDFEVPGGELVGNEEECDQGGSKREHYILK
jgi:hypothetical protein